MRKISRVIAVSLATFTTVYPATKDGAFAQQRLATTQSADQGGARTSVQAQMQRQQALAELREKLTTDRLQPVDFSTCTIRWRWRFSNREYDDSIDLSDVNPDGVTAQSAGSATATIVNGGRFTTLTFPEGLEAAEPALQAFKRAAALCATPKQRIAAEVHVVMNQFVILNTGKETWKSAVLALNGSAFTTRIIEPFPPVGVGIPQSGRPTRDIELGGVVIPQIQFTDAAGNRFNPVQKEARTLTITCTRLDGSTTVLRFRGAADGGSDWIAVPPAKKN